MQGRKVTPTVKKGVGRGATRKKIIFSSLSKIIEKKTFEGAEKCQKHFYDVQPK